eukprot:TRINITY_DN65245_c0_g1_i1.p1 TRINITY_DN65245_c0_g1~~TRINITY_DN65245_c0_g1_i1.p1  ORF type:complete len:112 (+),score=10.47 TRINITY_DN65245_c0_g1_i1:27-338(+)
MSVFVFDDGSSTAQATYLILVASSALFVTHIFEQYNIRHVIPESGVIMIVGTASGFLGWMTGSVSVTAASTFHVDLFELVLLPEIGRAVQQECRDRSRMPSSA